MLNSSDRAEFGAVLRRLRNAAGLSQAELAERAQISCQTISSLERGKHRVPQRDTLRQLISALALPERYGAELMAVAERGRRRGPAFESRRPGASGIHHPTNLARSSAVLIGRDQDVIEITAQVMNHRLSVLVGAGGIGKTSVAMCVASNMLAVWSGGVWFVDLAPISNSQLVHFAVASALGIPEADDRSIIERLTERFRTERSLIVLDNCEHVIDAVAELVAAILPVCHGLHVLATSREPLRIDGENVYRLPSLAVPSAEQRMTSQSALAFSAVALFVERVRTHDRSFRLDEQAAQIVGDIARRLGGIPLATELAAARVRTLGVSGVAARLNDHWHVLPADGRVMPARNRTMRSTIEWSHALLSEAERELFRRLSVFSGGWTLEAAERVCSVEDAEADLNLDVLNLQVSLVDKSLVVVEFDGAGRPRYRFFETIRAFAQDQLDASLESVSIPQRHASWMADVADDIEARSRSSSSTAWLMELEPEVANASSALKWAVHTATGVNSYGPRIVVGFARVWERLGQIGEGRRWVEMVLPLVDELGAPGIAARLWHALALFTFARRSIEAAERAIAIYERVGDRYGLAQIMVVCGEDLRRTGRYAEAGGANDRAVMLFQSLGATRSEEYAEALVLGANLLRRFGRTQAEGARRLFGEALDIYAELGDEGHAALTRVNLAELEFAAGGAERAVAIVNDALGSLRRAGMSDAIARCNLAAYRLELGDDAGAWRDATEALAIARRTGFTTIINIAISHLGTIAARAGYTRRAARLRGYVDAWYRAAGAKREATERHIEELCRAALQAQISDEEITELAAEGATLTMDDAIAIASGCPLPRESVT